MLTLQLTTKELIRPLKGQKILKDKRGYGVWQKYTNKDGTPFYNRERFISNEKVLNVFN